MICHIPHIWHAFPYKGHVHAAGYNWGSDGQTLRKLPRLRNCQPMVFEKDYHETKHRSLH